MMADPLPPPGDLRMWAIHWQSEGANLSKAAREWRGRDSIIANTYDETAATYYGRARHLVTAMGRIAHD